MVSFLGTIVLGVSAGYVIWEQQKIKSWSKFDILFILRD